MTTQKQLREDQSGLVSIMVTLVLIIVITLIVIGFSEVVRRNQREALDRQLSTQAYYAAETGINDAYNAVFKNNYSVKASDGTNCTSFIAGASLSNGLNSDSSVEYTCLLVNNIANNVVETVPLGSSQNALLQMSAPPGTLTFQWQSGQTPLGVRQIGNCSTNSLPPNQFTPASLGNNWLNRCPYGILRVDLFDNNAAPGDAESMTNATVNIFFVPTTGGATSAIAFGNQAASTYTVTSKCDDATELCTGTISGINGTQADGTSHYYARLSSVYESVGKVTITAGNAATNFTGYLIIDATGKAQDVLRRVQVRVPFSDQTSFPTLTNALASGGSICKRYGIMGSGDTAGGGDDTNIPAQLCSSP